MVMMDLVIVIVIVYENEEIHKLDQLLVHR